MTSNVEGFTNKSKINEEAAKWILFLEDTPNLSDKQITALNDWVATSTIHRQCIEQMAQSWGEMDLLTKVMAPQEVSHQSLFSSRLSKMYLPFIAVLSIFILTVKRSKTLLRPAVLLPAILFTTIFFTVINLQTNDNPINIMLTTNIGENIKHDLPDGSILWLNSSSSVQINYSENFRRISLLSGEAYFEVAKEATRPFEVYADDRLVRAVGTAFTVHKLAGKIEVLVSEGTVELALVDKTLVVIPDDYNAIEIEEDFDGRASSTVALFDQQELHNQPASLKQMLGKLTAGQRVSIPVDNNDLSKNKDISHIEELDTSEVTRFLSWKDGKLVFAGESLEEVIKEITRHTQVKIDVIDPKLKSMRIGGQFQVGETDTLFYVLESGFGISVKKLDDNHVQLHVKEQIK